MKKDVKRNLLNHSEAKVKLLREYLQRYLNIITNDGYTEQINIFDLFCGEGIYDDGGEGSPLVIMRAIKDIHFKNVAHLKSFPKINCFFNDIDEDKVKKVKNAIESKKLYYPSFGSLTYTSDDYKDYLKKLEKRLGNYRNKKAFIFIDPYDYKYIKISQIKKLMANKKSEVLLWLPTQFMYRFETNGTPMALKDFLEEIVTLKDWKSSGNVWNFIKQMKDGFQRVMGNSYFVDYFTIQKNSNTVYCLFFFTSHIRGFEKMLEAKWKLDAEQGKGWEYSGNQPSLFFQQKTNLLAEKLETFLKAQKRTNGEVYEFTLRQGFLPKHTNEIFIDWQQNGILKVFLKNGNKVRKKAFYDHYKYYKTDSNKVIYIIE